MAASPAACDANPYGVARTFVDDPHPYARTNLGLVGRHAVLGWECANANADVNIHRREDPMSDPRENLIRFVSQLLAVADDGQESVFRSVPVLVLVTDPKGEVTDWRLQTLADAAGLMAALDIAGVNQ